MQPTQISIIIPTFNRPEHLSTCLRSITQLNFPKSGFEVVVVDDGGNVELEPIIQPLREEVQVQLIRQKNTGPAGARNNGAAHARGEFIAFTDDDCIPDGEWLLAYSRCLKKDPLRLYGGRTINGLVNNIYSTASQLVIDHLYEYYNRTQEGARFFTSNNLAMTRAMFGSVGGFDTCFSLASGEDREFCDRWLHSGHRMTYVPDACVTHNHNLGFSSFRRQHFSYGRGAWHFREVKRRRSKSTPKLEPPPFYLGILCIAWKKNLPRPWTLSMLMVLSQLANAVGFFWEMFNRKTDKGLKAE